MMAVLPEKGKAHRMTLAVSPAKEKTSATRQLPSVGLCCAVPYVQVPKYTTEYGYGVPVGVFVFSGGMC